MPHAHSTARLTRLALTAALVAVLALVAIRPAPAHALEPGAGAPTPVYRYWSQANKDWMSIPQHGSQTVPDGYQQYPNVQFYVDMIGNPGMVAVFRWWQPTDQDWVDVVDGNPTDAQMTAWGYTSKTFQWYAFPGYQPNTIPVYRWWQPQDQDWITLAQGEIPDATMQSSGYENKTFLFSAYPKDSPTGETGYFPLGTSQTAVLDKATWGGRTVYPHTLSVLDVNPTNDSTVNKGYRYLGYFGTTDCNGIGIARTNDLNAAKWQEDPDPVFSGGERWASALRDKDQSGADRIDVVNNVDYCGADYGIYARESTDGLNGTQFTDSRPLVKESDHSNGNPTIFEDPSTGWVSLYWWRYDPATTKHEIRVKSAPSFDDLLTTSPTDIGQVVASSYERIAAPQVVSVDGIYYLAVEAYENGGIWKTRVLTSAAPSGPFYEVPGNPLYGDGSACVFQQVFDGELHTFYCHQGTPGQDTTWTLDHVSAPLKPV